MNCDPAVVVSDRAAGEALALRDQALAALDRGDPPAALAFAARGLVVLEAAGLGGGPDEAALLVAVAEIQEALGRFGDAGVTIATAIAIPRTWQAMTMTACCCGARRRSGWLAWSGWRGTSTPRRPGSPSCWTGRRRRSGRRRWRWCRRRTRWGWRAS